MLLFAITLLCLSSVVALISGVWTVALAFQRDVKWGLAVLLVPPFGNLAFLCVDWREARVPFFVGFASLLLMGSTIFAVPAGVLPFQSAITAVQTDRAQRAEAAEQKMQADRDAADEELRLAHLKREERTLLSRKAEMVAGNQAAAEKLSGEIRHYNTELKAVLAQASHR